MAKKEYIERNALKNDGHSCWHDGKGNVYYEVDHAPAADVVEVMHGAWVEHFSFGGWHYDCPFCDDGYATKARDKTPPNYCPNCGAKMDGVET